MPAQSILIIDDEEDIRNLLSLVLQNEGFSVNTASGGQDALRQIAREKPSLVILDLLMPDMPGEEVCRIIKTDPALRDILVMVLSAKSDLESRLNCLTIGAEEYLVKPIDIKELVLRVNRFLGWKDEWQKKRSNLDVAVDLEDKTAPTLQNLSAEAPLLPEQPGGSANEQKASYGIYRIESLAGAGGMGLVYKAHDEILDRQVAIKVLSKEWSGTPEVLQRFHTEAKLIATINHPCIAQIYTFAQEAGEAYFALEWCPGGSVASMIRHDGKIDLLRAIDMILQCARGLEAAWMKGVVHRDIKPGNLMFDEYQQIKIVDFGVAFSRRAPVTLSDAEMVIGSPAYMAPEQARGEDTDHRTDIYSLGITFYRMLYGRLPFPGNTALEWIEKHAMAPFPPYDDLKGKIPAKAYQIIEKMTQKDPAARYEKYSDLIDDLEKLRNELYSQRRLKIPVAVAIASTASYKNNNFLDLLADVYRREGSGLLKVSWGELEKQFLLLHNEIILFDSPQPEEDLWYVLINRNLMRRYRIPSADDDMEEALNGLLFSHALTPEVLRAVYREMMLEAVLQVFHWPECEAEFTKATIKHDPFTSVSLARIIIEGARTLVPYEILNKNLPTNQFIFRTSKFEDILATLNLTTSESFLASRLEGENITIETLQSLTGFSLELIGRTLYALERMGALEYRSPVKRPRRRKIEQSLPETEVTLPENGPIKHQKVTREEQIDIRSTTTANSERNQVWIKADTKLDLQTAAKYYKRAEEQYESGHYWEVERLCASAIKNNPREAKYHHLMAVALTHHPHSIKAAEESFRQAIHLDPENLQYRFDLADLLKERGNLDDAFYECAKILEMSPDEERAKRLQEQIELDRLNNA